jgi:uncharacterized protein YjbI with pentapeptide repeats
MALYRISHEVNKMNVDELLKRHAAAEQNFPNVDLSAVNLREANLIGANLTGANLSQTDLREARIGQVNVLNKSL